MRFVQFLTKEGIASLGVQLGIDGKIVNLSSTGKFPHKLVNLLRLGKPAIDQAQNYIGSGSWTAIDHVEKSDLLSPITDIDKVICVGLNYKDHCEEQGADIPKEPVIFSKFSSCITPPFGDVVLREEDSKLDWEVELAFVISKAGKRIEESEAMNHVFGYTVGFDVSERNWQFKNGGQWLLGKTMDTFCPLGPAIVTVDELGGEIILNL